MFAETLKDQQPVVYQVLQNALKQERVSHAYMFVGDAATPKKATALLFAQSLVCQHRLDYWACENCDTCKRLKNGNYADLIYLDGTLSGISKEMIVNLKSEFAKSNSELNGRKIYIIDKCENASESALNSLLTFLEEPQSDAVAILLVDNPEKMLNTIISRCQVIKFKPMNKQAVYEHIKTQYNHEDAYLLSRVVKDFKQIETTYESDAYQQGQYAWKEFMQMYVQHDYRYRLFLLNEAFPRSKKDNKEVLDWFLDLVELCASDCLLKQVSNIDYYDKIIKGLDPKQALHLFSVANEIRDANIKGASLNLLIDQMLFKLEDNDER